MKKLFFVFLTLFVSVSLFAQTATVANENAPQMTDGEEPKEIVTTTTEEVYAEITPEKEAQELTDMLTQEAKINDDQKKEIYKIVLNALKEKVKLEPLREDDAEKFAEKEMEIYKTMNDKINELLTKG